VRELLTPAYREFPSAKKGRITDCRLPGDLLTIGSQSALLMPFQQERHAVAALVRPAKQLAFVTARIVRSVLPGLRFVELVVNQG
jgi:hypothetical protein